MPLVLSLKEGDDFWVEDQQVIVSKIKDGAQFTLQATETGTIHEITETKSREVFPDVFVSAGGFFKYGAVRVVLEAPRSIEILRGDRYRAKHTKVQDGVS